MILEVGSNDFEREVINFKGKVIADFWAPWCNPCKMMHPVFENLDKEVGDVIKIVKVNIDDNPELASKFGVMSIPTFIVFENGEMIDSKVGVQSIESLKEMLDM